MSSSARAISRSPARALPAVLAAAALLACSGGKGDPAPQPRAVVPDRGPQGAAVAVRIEGSGLDPHVLTDYGDASGSVLDARFVATLGGERLRDVRPSGDGALLATVPEDLPSGAHDLVVTDPGGRQGTLPNAYQVVPAGDPSFAVASFRFDAVGPQQAMAPFAVTVTALDAAGQTVTTFSGTASLSDRTGAFVPVTTGPFAWGVWQGSVEVRAASVADALTATDVLGHAGSSNDFVVAPSPAARIVFTSAPIDTVAGACAGPVAVALEDLYGAPTTTASALDVAIAGGGAVAIYADAACAVPSAGATIPAGGGTAQVWVRGTVAGSFTLGASAGALVPGTLAGTTRPAPPDRLVFTTAPQTVVAGVCSATAVLAVVDAYGNASPVPADTAVALGASPPAGFELFAGAGCGGAAIASIAIPSGGTGTSISFRGTAAGAVGVTAAGAGIPTPASQAETILPAAPDRLLFSTPPQTVVAGVCSGPATVVSHDALGNVAPVAGGASVGLSSTASSGFSFYAGTGCSGSPVASVPIAAGGTSATFSFRATVAESVTVTAAGAGIPTAATQVEAVVPAAPDHLVFTTAPQSVPAGSCSAAATVESRDQFGNVSPVSSSTAVALSSTATGTLDFFAGTGCSGAATASVTMPAGTATATFSFRATKAETVTVTATGAGIPTAATQVETILPAAPDRLVFATPAQTVVAGVCSGPATVVAYDTLGNVSPLAGGAAVALSSTAASGFSFYAGAGCGGTPVSSVSIPAGGSDATFSFRATVAEAVTVAATGAGIPTAATQVETIVPAAPDRLVFSTPPQTIAAGACSAAATVVSYDALGNVAPVPGGTSVALSSTASSGFSFYAGAGCGGSPIASVSIGAGGTSATFSFRATVAESVTVTATGAGIPTPATQVEAIVPAAPDRLVFTTPPQTVAAGACSAAATVESRDQFGNVSPVASSTAVGLASTATGAFDFFAGAGCGGAATASVTMPAGTATATFSFRATRAESVTVTATGASIPTAATQVETIVPAAPDRLVFTTPPQSVPAGSCSAAATVESRDQFGNVSPVTSITAVALASTATGTFDFHAGTGCAGAAVASLSIAAGASDATFSFRATKAESVTVTATGAGIPAPAAQVETIGPAAPDHLVFSTPAQTVVAGACSGPATVVSYDGLGNVAPVAGGTTVTLSSSAASGFSFYAGAGCSGSPAASVTIPAGGSDATFSFRATVAESVTVTAAGAGIPTAATQVETIVPAAPDHLVFTTPPQTVAAGACSAAATVESRDQFGNVSPVVSSTPVALASTATGTFDFFAGAGCGGTATASITMGAGSATATFSFRATKAESVTVTATGAGIPTAATQAETIVPAAPDRLVYSTPAQAVVAGACSGPATVVSYDALGNVSPVAGGTTVALSSTAASGFSFYAGAGCIGTPVTSASIPPGGSDATFSFRATVAESVTVTATGAGIPTAATQVETIVPAAPDHLVFTTPPQTVAAGACSAAATVESRDQFGNVSPVVSSTAVALASTATGTFEFFAGAGCGGAATASVTMPAGTATATFSFRATKAETVTVTAAGASIPTAATQVETIVPAAPDRLVFSTPAQTVVAGVCSGPATVVSYDALGNVSPAAGGTTVALSSTAASGFSFYAGAGCSGSPVTSVSIPPGGSDATFSFRATVAEAVTVTATGASIPTAATQVETIVPAAPDHLVFTTPPQTVAAGACSAAATVESRDQFGNVSPVASSTAVALASTATGTFDFFAGAGCGGTATASVTMGAGSAMATFSFRATKAESVTVSATGASIPTAATQVETIVPAAPDHLVFTTPPQTVAAGACSAAATVESRDQFGNVSPVPASTAVALASTATGTFDFFAGAGCGGTATASVTMGAGSATATFSFRATKAESVTVSATGASIPTAATQAGTIVPAAPDRLVFSTLAQTVVAGVCSGPATVVSYDAYGNVAPVAGGTSVALSSTAASGFSFHAGAGCGGSPVTSVSIPPGGSDATFSFRATVAEAVTVTATGAGIPTAATQAETVVPAAPDRLVFTTPPQTVTAGVCSAAATVESRDQFGNVSPVVSSAAVALASTATGTFDFFAGAGCGGAATSSVTMGAGSATATFSFRARKAEAVTVTATGAGIPTAATQVETIVPAAPDHLAFSTAAQTVAAGVCSGPATVVSYDAYGNVTPVTGGTAVALSSTAASGFSFYAGPGCGGAPVASVSIPPGGSDATFSFRATVAESVTVGAAGASIPTAATQVETIVAAAPDHLVFSTPAQTVVAGVCSGPATVVSYDVFGNVAAVAGGTSVALSSTAASGFSFHAGAGCGGSPVTSVSIPPGGSDATVSFVATKAESVTVTATGASIPAAATQVETIVPAAPDHLVFTTAPQTVAAGVCSARATVESLDQFGNVSAVTASTSIALVSTATGTFQFFPNAGCGGGPTTTVTMAAASSTARFYFQATVAESVTVTATGAGIPTPAIQVETIVPAAPDHLAFSTAAQTVVAGVCSGPATVVSYDALGNVAPVAGGTTVALSSTVGGGLSFYAGTGCGGAPVASVPIPAGGSGATFSFRSTVAASVTVTAAGAGIPTAATQVETVVPAAPDRLVFTTPPQTVAAGACSAAATVESRDQFGNPSPVAASTAVALAQTATGAFDLFAGAGCGGAPTASVTIPAGGTTATFSFRATKAEGVTITATAAGLPTPATQVETIVPAAPDRLVFSTSAQTVAAGACSGAATVVSYDAWGNVAPVAGGTTVALSSTAASGFSFHAGAGCGGAAVASVPIAAGGSGATFSFRATAAETVTVTAAGAGIPTAATQAEAIVPAAPDRLVFSTSAQTVVAGVCSGPATVVSYDAWGNVAPVAGGTAVALSSTAASGFSFHAGAGCGGAPVASVSIAAGGTSATFSFTATVAESVTVTAAGAGIPTAAAQVETIVPAAPDRLVFTTPPQTVTAGVCSAAATVESRDQFGNVSPVTGNTAVALASTATGTFDFFAAAGCGGGVKTSVTMAAGTAMATFSFRATKAEGPAVTATGAGIPTAATQAETVVPAAPDHLAFTTSAQTVTAGVCSALATVVSYDAFGNVAPVAGGTTVALSSTAASGFSFYAGAGCGGAPVASVPIAAGGSSATFSFRATVAAAVTVTATGAGIPTAAMQAETIAPAAPDHVVFTTAAQTLRAGECSGTARIELRDAFGNPTAVAGAATPLQLSAAPPAGFELFEDPACAVAVPGSSIEIAAGAIGKDLWFRGTVAPASVTLTSAPAGLTGASQVETIDPAAASAVAFATAPQSLVAGDCSAVAVVVALDAWGNVAPVPGGATVALSAAPAAGFAFHDAAGCGGAPVASAAIPAGGSTATFRFRGTAAGTVTITASAFSASATQGEAIAPAAPDHLAFTTSAQTVTAGVCSGPATVASHDAFGNVSPVAAGTTVALSSTAASGFSFYAGTGCGGAPVASVPIAAGGSSATFSFRATVAATVTVTAAGAGIPTAATQVETVVPASADRLAFTTAPQTAVAGVCSAAATVESRDQFGNPSPVTGSTAVALASTATGTFDFFAGAGCGGPATASVTIPAGATAATFSFRATKAEGPTVTATGAGIPTPATQAETIVPAAPDRLVFSTSPQTVVAGVCSGAATVVSYDAYGNVAPVTGGTTVALSSTAASGFSFYAGAGCAGGPVASVPIAAGGSSATFSFRATVAGSPTVTAAGAGIPTAATQPETIVPASPDHLAFSTSAQTVVAGTCSGPATVVSYDALGNVSPVAGGTTVSLSSTAASGFAFYAGTGCAGGPVASVPIAAGGSSATFSFRATVAGSVTVTATGASIPTAAIQGETVTPALADHFAFDPVPTPEVRRIAFPVRIQALDLYGNLATGFGGAADLTLAVPQPPNAAGATLSCPSGCGAGTTTSAFGGGVWTGSLAIDWTNLEPTKLGVTLRATGTGSWSAVTGISNPFDVTVALRSPPTAALTATPVVIRTGQSVSFDASGSSDYQTPVGSLQVSWDFQGTSTAAPAYPAPAAPWTAWTTTKTASNTYTVAGTYLARVAVRDADGDLGFASVSVVVLDPSATLCTVDTSADVDDGATSCAGPYGTDGKLSLAEAIRVAPTNATITFSAPMTITGTGSYSYSNKSLTIVAPAGTVLDTKSISIGTGASATGLSVVGLAFANQATAIALANKGTLAVQDCTFTNGAGINDRGVVTVTRTTMSGCTSSCLVVGDAAGADTLVVRHSTFRGSGSGVAIDLAQCSPSKKTLVAQSNVFTGLQTAIRYGTNCVANSDIQNNTFASNGTGVAYPVVASNGQVLRNNVFTGQTTAAVALGLATFTARDYHLLFQNASDGGIAGDPSTLAGVDPLYLFDSAGDYRLSQTSPGVNTALDTGLYLLPQYPATAPRFLGAGPDRGGRESF